MHIHTFIYVAIKVFSADGEILAFPIKDICSQFLSLLYPATSIKIKVNLLI